PIMKEINHTPSTNKQIYTLTFHLDCAFAHLNEMHFPTLYKDPQTRQAYHSLQNSLAEIHQDIEILSATL
ncbi:MAG: hypothetical protein OIF56_05330, partial [Cohaesibacter sp.]|nr:hypothetical protein [Cohaesibacter sp.]MCV6602925.1 hypothetical protein [Cohaesibacter sp.]